MALLVRKINRAKWKIHPDITIEEIPADAITHCLKTSQNSLSTWRILDRGRLPDAVLAILAAGDHIETFDVVCIDSDLLESDGISLENTEGNTKFKNYRKEHVDISQLTHKTLGVIAEHIASEIQINSDKRFTKIELIQLLADAVDEGKIRKEDLKASMKSKLDEFLLR